MNQECPIALTQAEYDELRQCEAVVIREFERLDGSRFGVVVAQGDAAEMADQAEIQGLFVVPVGLSIVGQRMVLVSDLLERG